MTPAQHGRRRWALASALVLCTLLCGCLWFRFWVVRTWHASAGDGLHYYALSQELSAHGRFAYAPPPAPPHYTRLPGYPLFLSYVAVRQAPIPMDLHLIRATRANVLLDLGTSVLIYLILRELGLSVVVAGLGLFAGLLCPTLILISCYGLTETLATFLATLELYLLLRAMRGRLLLYAALIGGVMGLSQLVRADALTLLPVVGLGLLWAFAPLRRRLLALLVCGSVAALVFAPWPLRNLRLFGHPYPTAVYGRTLDGRPFPDAVIHWERTWGSGAKGQSYLDLPFYFDKEAGLLNVQRLLPVMGDSPEERDRILKLLLRYNTRRFSPEVVAGFTELARERAHRDPLRTFVTLPLLRIGRLWVPIPDYELPMKLPAVDMSRVRPVLSWWNLAMYPLAAVGCLWLLLGGAGSLRRKVGVLLLLLLFLRNLLYGFAVPLGVNQRYLVEAFPVLIGLAACGVFGLFRSVKALAASG